MAVKIRLRRMGSKNAAFYRVIVQDSRRAPTGRFIETLGWYDPKQEGINFSLNLDRADYWLSNGAQPSDTAASLIKKARTLPVEQAVSGEVTEEEVPAAAVEAEEAAEAVVVEEVVVEEATEAVEEVTAEEAPVAEEATETPADEEATEEKV
jgi:small subunit ribosomal protein S16